jgi:hypothetical protein
MSPRRPFDGEAVTDRPVSRAGTADQRQVMFHMRLFQSEKGMTSPV